MLTPTLKLDSFTIDHATIKKALARAERNSMTKQLAFIRQRAKTGLRRRKKPSRPGQTPSVHSKDKSATLKAIFFVYDADTRSGIVGPVKQHRKVFGITNNGTIPQTLEHGGTYRVTEEHLRPGPGGWVPVRRSRRSTPGRRPTRRRRTVNIQPRPFMKPALDAEIAAGTIMEPWRESFGA